MDEEEERSKRIYLEEMRIKNSQTELDTPSGPMRTYVFEPQDEIPVYREKKYPGIIFFSAIFQVTPGIDRMARRLASEGYIVYVPEIYHMHGIPPGTVFNADVEGTAKGNLLKKSTKLEDWENDVKVLVSALKQNERCSGRIGVIGHCIGGHLSLRAALNPDILCACSFFPTDVHSGTLGLGEKADTIERFNDIKGEVTIVWGRQDPHIPDEGRLKVYQAIQKSTVKHTWHEFNANHTFLMDNDPKGRYDASVSEICFHIIFDVFYRCL